MNPDPTTIKSKRSTKFAIALAVTLLIGLIAYLTFSGRRSSSAESQPEDPLAVTSRSFSDGGVIPRRYTCDGAGISPDLRWAGAPEGTKSFALVMHDPDAPADFTHWLAYNIPPGLHELPEGASTGGAMPEGSAEGANDFGRAGYGGPCPPAGAAHHYVFQLYALDSRLNLPAGVDRNHLELAMKSHVVAGGKIVGEYGR
jgi:Raf kinase inhibitor-like YbhB/YbcL family protein